MPALSLWVWADQKIEIHVWKRRDSCSNSPDGSLSICRASANFHFSRSSYCRSYTSQLLEEDTTRSVFLLNEEDEEQIQENKLNIYERVSCLIQRNKVYVLYYQLDERSLHQPCVLIIPNDTHSTWCALFGIHIPNERVITMKLASWLALGEMWCVFLRRLTRNLASKQRVWSVMPGLVLATDSDSTNVNYTLM